MEVTQLEPTNFGSEFDSTLKDHSSTKMYLLLVSCHFSGAVVLGTHEDERTVLYRTKSLDGTKPDTNPKTNPQTNPNLITNPNANPKLTQILTLFSCFMLFFEHRPLNFSLTAVLLLPDMPVELCPTLIDINLFPPVQRAWYCH